MARSHLIVQIIVRVVRFVQWGRSIHRIFIYLTRPEGRISAARAKFRIPGRVPEMHPLDHCIGLRKISRETVCNLAEWMCGGRESLAIPDVRPVLPLDYLTVGRLMLHDTRVKHGPDKY
jgi:hypothetical protein